MPSSSDDFERMKREAMASSNKADDLPVFMIPNTFFAFVGGLITAYLLFRLVKGSLNCFKVFCCGKGASGGVDLPKLGKWAVVTGATDGIGKSYAEELADEGINIVLISRTKEKLDQVAADIRKNSGVDTKVIVADYSKTDIYEAIGEQLVGLDIGILVNNVGMGYTYPEAYHKVSAADHAKLLNINCMSVLRMMSLVLPDMVTKKRGAIINVSSASGVIPTALLSSYSASKAFVDFLSKAVNQELLYSESNVIVQSVTPFFVRTKLSGIRKSSFMVPEPGYFARSALNTVGVWDHTYGCLAHEIQGIAFAIVPTFLIKLLSYRELWTARGKFLKRAARQQQEPKSEEDKKVE